MPETARHRHVDALNTRAWDLAQTSLDEALDLSQQAHALAANAPEYRQGLADSLRTLAWVNSHRNQTDEAMTQALRALDLYTQLGFVAGQAHLYYLLSRINLNTDDYASALEYAIQGLALCRQADLPTIEAWLYKMMGNVYGLLGEYDASIQAFQAILDMPPHLKDPTTDPTILNNMCFTYSKAGQYALGIQYGRQGLCLARQRGYDLIVSACLHSIGDNYLRMGEYAQALSHFQAALDIARQQKAMSSLANNLASLGETHWRRGEHETAIVYLHEALAAAGDQTIPANVAQMHRQLAAIYKAQGNYQQALEHQEQYQALYERLHNERLDRRLRHLQQLHTQATARLEAQAHYHRTVALQLEIERRDQVIEDLDAYAGHVAHDLRGLVAVVMASSELLLSDDPREDPCLLPYLRNIRDTSHQMDQVVEGLLSLARTRQQAVELRPVAMERVWQAARQRVQAMAERYEATIALVTPLPRVLGVEAWLEEAWVNYLTNAIKYGGRPPQITVGATEVGRGAVQFWVQDNGDGIAEDEQAELFHPFHRLNGANGDGHGLGLSIVKTIVEKLGGQVGVESAGEPGQGATFTFTLQAADAYGSPTPVARDGHVARDAIVSA